MSELKELGKQFLDRHGLTPDECAVRGCDHGNAETINILPLDPIDHSSTLVQLCPRHTVWAEKRNELAEEIADELREYRKEIGQERIAEVQELANPNGTMSQDYLMGDESAEMLEGDQL